MSRNLTTWDDHEIETMKKMWLAGNSATEIARALRGRSRNSVISKVHRLGLTRERLEAKASPPSTGRVPAVKRNRATGGIKVDKPAPPSNFARIMPSSFPEAEKKRAHFAAKGAGIIEGFAEAANDTAVLLIERRRFQCAWPVGESAGAALMCCGQPVDPEATKATASYCPEHRKRASGGIPRPPKEGRPWRPAGARGERSARDLGRAA